MFGGGNVAMDAVRTAKRLGAGRAICAYRRTKAEMPARVEEIAHAEEEGIEFQFLVAPLEILGDEQGWVRAVTLQRMELGEPDDSGRRRPVPVPGSEFELPCEIAIVALGTVANPLLTNATPGLELNKWGNIVTDENHMTSMPGVFAGGDIVRGGATVILAMGDGKEAARSIDESLRSGVCRRRGVKAGGSGERPGRRRSSRRSGRLGARGGRRRLRAPPPPRGRRLPARAQRRDLTARLELRPPFPSRYASWLTKQG